MRLPSFIIVSKNNNNIVVIQTKRHTNQIYQINEHPFTINFEKPFSRYKTTKVD